MTFTQLLLATWSVAFDKISSVMNVIEPYSGFFLVVLLLVAAWYALNDEDITAEHNRPTRPVKRPRE